MYDPDMSDGKPEGRGENHMARERSTRREFLKVAGAGALAAALGRAAQAAGGRRPNIVFIFSDDHAYQAISAYGDRLARVAPTPNIDRLADEGMRFDQCCVTNSICAPSRAVILTGKHSHLNGVRDNRARFDGSQQTFPKLLQRAGYTTAIFGKWHLKSEPTGFDAWEVLPGQGAYYNPDFRTPAGNVRVEGYVTDVIADKALAWLKTGRDRDKPFMVMIQNKAPHRAWEPGPDHLTLFDDVEIPEPDTLFDNYATRGTPAKTQKMEIDRHMNFPTDLKLRKGGSRRLTAAQRAKWEAAYNPKNEKFERNRPAGRDLVRWKYQRYMKDYLRCIRSVDDNVGRVLDYLDASGLARDTVVAYSSDQGFYLGEHGWFDKRFMYTESFRTPLLVRWPGLVQPGSTCDALVQNLDFAQTFLDIARTDAPDDMQGASLVPLMMGISPRGWRKSLYYHYFEYPGAHSVRRHVGVFDGRYKLMHFYRIDEWELYDLKADPREMRNLYGDARHASTVERLKAELARLRDHYKDHEGGQLKHAAFPVINGLGSIEKKRGTWNLSASEQAAYALRKLDAPITGRARIHGTMRTLLSDGIRNGQIAIAWGPKPQQVLRCGVYIGAGSYVVLHGEEQIASKNAPFNKAKTFDVTLDVDVPTKKLTMTVDGTAVTAALPQSCDAIRFAGYGLNVTQTAFGELRIDVR